MRQDDDSGTVLSPRVRRVGDVIHTTSHARSGYVAQVLTHLESVGFRGAPRWLGTSPKGDDLLTFIEGAVLDDPPYNLNDGQLTTAAELIREFHNHVAGTDLCEGAETVCHGDLGPRNTIFRAGRPVALIDWDADVRPGRRAADFADAVWSFTDLTSEEVPVAEQARRVAVMCAAYPPMTPAVVVSELTNQFQQARSRHQAERRQGPLAVFEGLLAWLDRHGRWWLPTGEPRTRRSQASCEARMPTVVPSTQADPPAERVERPSCEARGTGSPRGVLGTWPASRIRTSLTSSRSLRPGSTQ